MRGPGFGGGGVESGVGVEGGLAASRFRRGGRGDFRNSRLLGRDLRSHRPISLHLIHLHRIHLLRIASRASRRQPAAIHTSTTSLLLRLRPPQLPFPLVTPLCPVLALPGWYCSDHNAVGSEFMRL